ncbi:MAG: hypothetical protein ACREJV_11585, partial [Candidatus Rokuibacteriota bacterium]
MGRRSLPWLAGVVVACLAASPLGAENPSDRLDRFRALAAARLSIAELADADRAAEAYRDLYALLDEEVVDSLASGGVFAAPAFLQLRMDGFAEAWGGAWLRLHRVGPLTIGTFQLSEGPGGSAVRVYGTQDGESRLVAALQRQGRPTLYPLSGSNGRPAVLIVWEGMPTGRGTRALRVDLVRQRGDDVAVVWSTAELFPEGLMARQWRVQGGEVRVRYELRYPGWTPGCEGQTEQEDVFRAGPDADRLVRASVRQHNAWHRALHQAVAGLVEALAADDGARLAALVPDPKLREHLPPRLERAPACDAPDGPEPVTVSVAATAGDHGPWSLIFRRGGGQWRLTAATPVLE